MNFQGNKTAEQWRKLYAAQEAAKKVEEANAKAEAQKTTTPRSSSARVKAREETDKESFDREEQGRDPEEQVTWLREENNTFVRALGGGREDSASQDQDDPQLPASSTSSSTPSPRPEHVESSEESQKNISTNFY
jgi:hypothetical protein